MQFKTALAAALKVKKDTPSGGVCLFSGVFMRQYIYAVRLHIDNFIRRCAGGPAGEACDDMSVPRQSPAQTVTRT